MHVTVLLRGPTAELRQHIGTLQREQVGSRRFLTREEYGSQFGARPEDIDAVSVFAHNHGLDILDVDAGKRTIQLAGTVGAMSRAFGVQLSLYGSRQGVFRARSGRIRVPAWLQPSIQGVLGLDARPLVTPRFRTGLASRAQPRLSGNTPVQIANLYNFPADADGSGQCVGILEFGGGFRQSDLDQYFGGLGITPPSVTAVSVAGGANYPTGPNGPDVEVMLDIEVVGSVAPGANIVVYFAPNTEMSFGLALLAAIHDTTHNPSIISLSWGAPEITWPAQARRMVNLALLSGLAMGVTVFVAAGDSGSRDGLPWPYAFVDFPASSPFAVGCGGTKLLASGGSITSETVWNDPMDGATGGGVSALFPVPSYQSTISPTSTNPGHRAGRGVPDVSGDASPITGYEVLVDGQTALVGGTSAVAPLWSGLLARVQQKLGHSVAPFLPAIYGQAGAFRDITVGNNGAYSAGPGWDACTGLGSPNGAELVTALSGAPAGAAKAADGAAG
jgi:kumamolisin